MTAHDTYHAQRCQIGVALGARTTTEAEQAMHAIAAAADIAEIRLDFMDEYNLARLLQNRPCPVVVTNRPARAGGRFQGSEEARLRPLREAIDLGAEYVDIEHDSVDLLGDHGTTRLMVSYHDHEKMPEDFDLIHRKLCEMGADVAKVIGTAQRAEDNLRVFDTLARTSVPTVAAAMGELGVMSRVLALRYPSAFLTYATLGRGPRVSPGQLTVAAMHDVYHARDINADTEVYGVLSDSSVAEVDLSNYNRGLREADTNAVCVPVQTPDRPAEVIGALRRLDIRGYSVLPPYQDKVEPALDGIDRRARERAAVNTIIQRNGKLWGFWLADQADQVKLWTDSLRSEAITAER